MGSFWSLEGGNLNNGQLIEIVLRDITNMRGFLLNKVKFEWKQNDVAFRGEKRDMSCIKHGSGYDNKE